MRSLINKMIKLPKQNAWFTHNLASYSTWAVTNVRSSQIMPQFFSVEVLPERATFLVCEMSRIISSSSVMAQEPRWWIQQGGCHAKSGMAFKKASVSLDREYKAANNWAREDGNLWWSCRVETEILDGLELGLGLGKVLSLLFLRNLKGFENCRKSDGSIELSKYFWVLYR